MRATMYTVFFLFFCISVNSCSDGLVKTTKKQSSKIEPFDYFLYKFNQDEIFRNQRIISPLPGFNSDDHEENYEDESEVLEEYYWDEEDIRIYLRKQYDSKDYHFEYKNINDSLREEKVILEGSGFEIIRKFRLIDNKWHLVYYFYRS